MAQTASQITPPSFRPAVENPSGGLAVPETQGLAAPAGAEMLFVRLNAVMVQGGFETLAPAAALLQARLTGRSVSGAEIFAAARDLEAAYAAAGYVLARVILPPQTLVNGGVLKLIVVDGFIEKIETKNVPAPVRARVAAVLAPLEGRRRLTLAEIERRVLLAGDAPGAILRSTLAPGEKAGATILVIEGKHEPIGAVASIDNSLAAALGRWTAGIGLDLNSVGSFGELVYVRANGDPNAGENGFLNSDPRNRALAAGVVVPIGFDGLSFNIEGTEARTNPAATAGVVRADLFDRASARVRYPFVRSRGLNVNGEVAFDAVQERQSLVLDDAAVPLALDRLRVLRLVGDANWEAGWGGVFAGKLIASFGFEGLGARPESAASPLLPLSRQFADASFDKLEAFFSYSQLPIDHLSVAFFAHAQTSFGQALALSEQIGLTGPTGLSSFNAGTLQGDSGVSLRAELGSPWALPVVADHFVAVAAPYAFAAAGAVFLQYPTTVEASRRRAACYGLGLRVTGAEAGGFANAMVAVEWGRQAESGGLLNGATQHGDKVMFTAAMKL